MGVEFDASEVLQLSAALGAASSAVIPLAHKVVVKSTADVKRISQRNAPVDTGNLRSSITGQTRGLVGEIGPTAEYGGYVERGTSQQAPQPYMAPALDAVAPSFEAAIAQVAEEAIGG